jgi:cyclic beta-1,2-glucan synthetase
LGLQLLATVSAYDLGLLPLQEMTGSLERAFQSLDRLPRFRGHFYNWYDLRTLDALEPAYISTVDSGNLAGHLLALRQACLAIAQETASPIRNTRTPASSRLATERARRRPL